MKILIFDTETISVEKPWCYNLGYIIYDTDGKEILCKRDFVIEQIWNNKPLFETAYYAEKRPLYIGLMRGRKAKLIKYGFAQDRMIRDIIKYQVQGAYAFNSAFDDRVITFNSDGFGCRNALDTIPVYDIRGYAIKYLCDSEYKKFCDNNEDIVGADGKEKKFITATDNYKTTAESFYAYLTNNAEYEEEHTALADSEIELKILQACIEKGATWQTEYECPRSIPREKEKALYIKYSGKVIGQYTFTSKTERKVKDGVSITLR